MVAEVSSHAQQLQKRLCPPTAIVIQTVSALMAMNQPQNTAGMEDTTVAALPAFRTALIPTKRSV